MGLWNLKKTYTGDVPPKATTATFCGVSAFRDACYQLVSAFLITYITFSGLLDTSNEATFLAQMGVISVLVIICRIWDGINDPIMGWIIEKFHFKWGKYKPWILIGGLMNTGVVLTLFLAHPTGWGFVVLFGVFYFLWDIAWTINDIAYWSMLPSLTKDEKRRNNITAIMQIFISIGVFAVYGVVTLLVGNVSTGASAQATYGIIATVITILFLLSQIALVVVCKEHVRDEEDEKKEQDDVKFKDMFLLFKRNKPFRVNILGILLMYLASGVIVGFGMYYCYLMFGYGTDPMTGAKGGEVSFMITIMYAVGTLVAQVLYPLLSKFLKRKQLFLISTILVVLGYGMFFITGFPIFGGKAIVQQDGLLFLLYVASFLLFAGQGIIEVAMIIQMQSTIEYNEWKYGERKEALVSSMRALVAKWGSAIQQGLLYATLAITGLYGIIQSISNYENALNANLEPLIVDGYKADMQNVIDSATAAKLNGLGVGMILIPLALLLVALFLFAKVFEIDETKYAQICADIDARKANK